MRPIMTHEEVVGMSPEDRVWYVSSTYQNIIKYGVRMLRFERCVSKSEFLMLDVGNGSNVYTRRTLLFKEREKALEYAEEILLYHAMESDERDIPQEIEKFRKREYVSARERIVGDAIRERIWKRTPPPHAWR